MIDWSAVQRSICVLPYTLHTTHYTLPYSLMRLSFSALRIKHYWKLDRHTSKVCLCDYAVIKAGSNHRRFIRLAGCVLLIVNRYSWLYGTEHRNSSRGGCEHSTLSVRDSSHSSQRLQITVYCTVQRGVWLELQRCPVSTPPIHQRETCLSAWGWAYYLRPVEHYE